MALASLARSLAPSLLRPACGASSVALRGFATDVAAPSGVPEENLEKRVVIFSPARTAGQQGLAKTIEGDTHPWSIRFPTDSKVSPGSVLWESPLITENPSNPTSHPRPQLAQSPAVVYHRQHLVSFTISRYRMAMKNTLLEAPKSIPAAFGALISFKLFIIIKFPPLPT
eukprot:scaffold130481_cov26-Prasinocladus_malaysianus.AAC.1